MNVQPLTFAHGARYETDQKVVDMEYDEGASMLILRFGGEPNIVSKPPEVYIPITKTAVQEFTKGLAR